VIEERRGGRRHQLLTPEEETIFLAPWIEKAAQGGAIVVPPLHAALEARMGHRVPNPTIYRLLVRHGWRELAPETRPPRMDDPVQGDFKKISRNPDRTNHIWRSFVTRSPFFLWVGPASRFASIYFLGVFERNLLRALAKACRLATLKVDGPPVTTPPLRSSAMKSRTDNRSWMFSSS